MTSTGKTQDRVIGRASAKTRLDEMAQRLRPSFEGGGVWKQDSCENSSR